MLATVENELRRRAAALLATGTMSYRATAQAVGCKLATISNWMRQDDFLDMVSELAKDQTKEIEEQINEASRLAMARLIAHITATNKQGAPIWDVQWNAIKLILAYKLGQPIEKTENKTLALSGDVNKTIQRMIEDPTVRQKLLPNVPPTIEVEVEPADHDDTASRSTSSGAGPAEVLEIREQSRQLLPGDTGSESMEQASTDTQSHPNP